MAETGRYQPGLLKVCREFPRYHTLTLSIERSLYGILKEVYSHVILLWLKVRRTKCLNWAERQIQSNLRNRRKQPYANITQLDSNAFSCFQE